MSEKLGLIVKMAEEMHENKDMKSFFEDVVSRTEEIQSQNSFASCERHTSEVDYNQLTYQAVIHSNFRGE